MGLNYTLPIVRRLLNSLPDRQEIVGTRKCCEFKNRNMIEKNDYIKARKTVTKYEKQLDLSLVNSSACYIMHRIVDNLIFVTTDKEYADRLYEGGEYIMKISQLFNPCC